MLAREKHSALVTSRFALSLIRRVTKIRLLFPFGLSSKDGKLRNTLVLGGKCLQVFCDLRVWCREVCIFCHCIRGTWKLVKGFIGKWRETGPDAGWEKPYLLGRRSTGQWHWWHQGLPWVRFERQQRYDWCSHWFEASSGYMKGHIRGLSEVTSQILTTQTQTQRRWYFYSE